MVHARWGLSGLGLALCLAAACGHKPQAPVEDRYQRSSPAARSYQVQRGDTLYSIAFRYGLDYRRVAAANRIPAPYTIYPGQYITLSEASLQPPPTAAATPGPTTGAGAATRPTAPSQAKKSPPVTKSSSGPATTTADPGTVGSASQPVSSWRWPARGRVIRGYSSSVHKGIDIEGRRGDPVLAAASGRVVYAGNGIVGLGELLIIKHNDIYLSAYGHNDRLLVAEGEVVQAGQKIALQGSSGTDRVKLHLEIRREGKPIDPKKVLPRR